MENVLDFIEKNQLIAKGDKIGIAVSGGGDSMALLNFFMENKEDLGCEFIVINVNHKIRKESDKDSAFVAKFCKENNIKIVRHTVAVPQYAWENNINLENAARILRYECFEKTAAKEKLTSIAIAHHMSDQAETVLLHLFRGSGLSGARGMEAKRGIYIRPFLNTEKTEIVKYLYDNNISYVEDDTNNDNTYSRNFIRNQVLPIIKQEWRNVEKNIVAFSKSVREDDDHINNDVNSAAIVADKNIVRIPLNYFSYSPAVISRVIFIALDKIKARSGMERKHLEAIVELKQAENGKKIDLPNHTVAIKEYEYITIMKKIPLKERTEWKFKIGKLSVPNYGDILVSKSISFRRREGIQVLDAEKISRKAVWRFKQDGDLFEKAGGGTKKLSAYLIDKKIPARARLTLPVLADGNEILAVAGLDVSEKVIIDDTTVDAYIVEYIKE